MLREPRRRRRAVSMTSLIDVIFLLLLFFMLSSTFSRFAEVEIRVGTGGAQAAGAADRMVFLRVSDTGLTLNGQVIDAADLPAALTGDTEPTTVLVSVTDTATAQTLADVLVALRPLDHLTVSVLESS